MIGFLSRFSLRSVLRSGLHHLLPSSCVLCGQHACDALCECCQQQFFTPARVRCRVCAMRLRTRGFNQTLEIARPLARLTGIALAPQLLLRIRDTRSQSLLAPQQRRNNVSGAFDICRRYTDNYADKLAGMHIGVVDDVITTGQTLNEIAATLKYYGAARITNLVFARTLR